jgi:cytochrome P450
MTAAADGDQPTTDELVTSAVLLLAAGSETTTGLLSLGLVALLSFPEPDALRLDRSGPPSLSFGGGIHYCLGAPPALLARFPALELAGTPVPRSDRVPRARPAADLGGAVAGLGAGLESDARYAPTRTPLHTAAVILPRQDPPDQTGN